jgi:putative ABC transport system substrate-binding protein
MRRREVIALLGGAAAWPLAARAQQSGIPIVGYLNGGSPEASANQVAAFRQGLSEGGYVDGRNVAIEFRWAHNENVRLPELAADLARRRVAVIAVVASTPAAFAAKAATATIPIVFFTGGDPVQLGLVASLNRPGGNVTGVTSMNAELGAKRLGLLHELLPGAAPFALLVNPKNPTSDAMITDVRAAATAIGRQVEVLTASTHRDIDTVFASLQKRVAAVSVSPDVLFLARRTQVVTLAVYHRVPAVFAFREDAEAGGLMSYGSSITASSRQVGVYTGRILKGEKPADLPVQLAAKFEFIINLQIAKLLGLEVPPTLLARADEVIE